LRLKERIRTLEHLYDSAKKREDVSDLTHVSNLMNDAKDKAEYVRTANFIIVACLLVLGGFVAGLLTK
jgi:hypothetical protein